MIGKDIIEDFRRVVQEEQKIIEGYSLLNSDEFKKTLQNAIERLDAPLANYGNGSIFYW